MVDYLARMRAIENSAAASRIRQQSRERHLSAWYAAAREAINEGRYQSFDYLPHPAPQALAYPYTPERIAAI